MINQLLACSKSLLVRSKWLDINQEHSGQQLPDFIKLSAAMNGLKGSVRTFALPNLHDDSSFEDLDNLLARYVDMRDRHESSLDSLQDIARKDKSGFKLGQLEPGGKSGKGQRNSKSKGKGETFPPQPPAYKGKGKLRQLPKREKWCNVCWKKGHQTQACWWNNSNQQHQQHQQQKAWHNPSLHQPWQQEEALRKRSQPQVYNIDQATAYTSLIPEDQPMLSFEHQTRESSSELQARATTQPASAPVYTIAHLDSFENASSPTETWGILVDTGAATSVAPKSFASDIELSPAPSTLQISTATGKAVKTYGLRTVHLQSHGLSLEVNFVIADVVTPLLGLDSMMKDSLSLRLD